MSGPIEIAAISGIPGAARTLWTQLCAEELAPVHELFDAVRTFEEKLARRSIGHTTIDPKLANELVATTQRLLGTLDETTPERTRRLVQASVRYLVVEDDADGDLDSILGLDDDAEVLNAVLEHLGLAAWTVPIP